VEIEEVEEEQEQEQEQEDEEEEDAEEIARREPNFILQVFQIFLLILRFAGLRQQRLFRRLLASGQIGRLLNITRAGGVNMDESEDERYDLRFNRRRRPDPNRFPKIPSEMGMELMNSGIFGLNEAENVDVGDNVRRKRLARRILDRELATGDYVHQKLNQRLMAQVRQFRVTLYLITNPFGGNDS